MQNNNEFRQAVEKLNDCISNVQCGVSITSDEGLYADSLYYRCREYIKEYDEAKYWESRFRRKQE